MKDNPHDSIVKFYDSYLVDDILWVVMEYVDGGALTSILQRTRCVRIYVCACESCDLMEWNHCIYGTFAHCIRHDTMYLLHAGVKTTLIDLALAHSPSPTNS